MFQMKKPSFYDFMKTSRENKVILKDESKYSQINMDHFLSEDFMIRSSKEAVKNILPFLFLLNDPFVKGRKLEAFKFDSYEERRQK